MQKLFNFIKDFLKKLPINLCLGSIMKKPINQNFSNNMFYFFTH